MKPHSTHRGRSRSSADAAGPSRAEDVLERIQSLTAELQSVQAEIYEHVGDSAEMMPRHSLLEDRGSALVFEQFRAALDQIRSVLWLCAEETDPGASHPQRRHQLARAQALLRALSTHSRGADDALRHQARETVSFFDRLDRVIDSYMQEGGTIANPPPGKPPKP